MQDEIVTRVLAEAARIEGSTQALASWLRAPESTLQRSRCDGEELTTRDAALRLTSVLLCRACGEEVVHGNLLAQLAKDAVHHSRAATGRTRRAVEASRASVARGREKIARSAKRVTSWTEAAQRPDTDPED